MNSSEELVFDFVQMTSQHASVTLLEFSQPLTTPLCFSQDDLAIGGRMD
jgi:hypothetical protein